MNNRSRIFMSIETIENNLKSSMTLTDVAENIGFSYYYYSHLFKAITGMSPGEYLNQRRLSDSVEALMTTDRKIIDIAMDYGYTSPEAFSRAFQRLFGQSPSDVRKYGLMNGSAMTVPIRENDLGGRQQLFREPEVVHLDTIYLAGIPFYYDLNNSKNDLSDQWASLTGSLDSITGIRRPPAFYQMQLWFKNQSADSIYFYIAVEVDKDASVPIQMTTKTVPPQTYLKFYHKGLANQVGETYRYIYEEWLPRTDYRLPHMFNFEYYGEESLGPYNPESVSEIYIPID